MIGHASSIRAGWGGSEMTATCVPYAAFCHPLSVARERRHRGVLLGRPHPRTLRPRKALACRAAGSGAGRSRSMPTGGGLPEDHLLPEHATTELGCLRDNPGATHQEARFAHNSYNWAGRYPCPNARIWKGNGNGFTRPLSQEFRIG
ncbi:conserved hypothetical protein [Streptomyces pristinaespiralis ATCC 25486]|uniref:Uncharacterized protein n=1 Tax=Streptomyces pristinaespiralis (strain ATCC 25486 / DSM 40338 / CBS 914.69 / JCM 4507 / KCC S-0507 / NBRC 13074 / NRRL 2958 / 5647) TaxID=457429 RepID=D6X5T1_STRE2|nr:conserved hypothetical protein [Streptomyces pristinaespiralis ATCC 25486]